MMEPDLSLKEGERVVFVLDAKWKEVSARSGAPKHGIDQRDMYQLYAYGKRYGCRAVALVYPQTGAFRDRAALPLLRRLAPDLPPLRRIRTLTALRTACDGRFSRLLRICRSRE